MTYLIIRIIVPMLPRFDCLESYLSPILDSMDHLKSELEEYLYYHNNTQIKLKINGLTPVQHRNQAIVAT